MACSQASVSPFPNEYLYRVKNIIWDTDGEEIDDLPEAMDVWATDHDGAVDAASDQTGWCIDDCDVRKVPVRKRRA